MATSGTNVFENSFPIDEIFEEAYERVGMRDITGYHLTSARRSLNIMLQEWANRGLHYWELAETNIDLVEGQAEYTFFRASTDGTSSTTTAPADVFGVEDILEMTFRSDRTQTTQTVGRPESVALPQVFVSVSVIEDKQCHAQNQIQNKNSRRQF